MLYTQCLKRSIYLLVQKLLLRDDGEIEQQSLVSKNKPVYNYHPWDLKIVAIVDRLPLFRGHSSNIEIQIGTPKG